MSKRRIALGLGANLLDRIVTAGFQLLLVPLLAAHWGLERYGGWAMLTVLPAMLVLGDLGFSYAATARMTMAVARGEFDRARTAIRSASQVVCTAALGVAMLGGVLALALPSGAIPRLPQTGEGELRAAIACLAAYTALVMGCGLLQAVYRSTGRFALGTLLATLTAVVENGLLVLVVLLGQGIGDGAAALLIGRGIGFGILAGVAASRRTGLFPGLSGGDAAVRRELRGPALAAMAQPLATALLLQGTVMALGLVAGAVAVPAYVAARTLSRTGLQAAQMLASAIMPEFAAASATGHRARLQTMVAMTVASATTIALSFALALGAIGPWIVQQWSGGHIHAAPGMMLAIAVSALCGSIWNPLACLLMAVNRQAEYALAHAALAFGGVALTFGFGASLGGTAPALALALVDLGMLVLLWRLAHNHWGPLVNWTQALPGLARGIRR